MAKSREKKKQIINTLMSIGTRAIDGLAGRLGILAEGNVGGLLWSGSDNITIEDILENQLIAIFSLESLRYPEQARLLGRHYYLES